MQSITFKVGSHKVFVTSHNNVAHDELCDMLGCLIAKHFYTVRLNPGEYPGAYKSGSGGSLTNIIGDIKITLGIKTIGADNVVPIS